MKHVQRSFLCIALLLNLFSINLYAQTKNLKFQHESSTLNKVVEQFGKQFRIQIAYTESKLSAIRVPAAQYEAGTVLELLNKLLAPRNLVCQVIGGNHVIKDLPKPRPANRYPTIQLEGVVSDADGPVSGVTVVLKAENKTVRMVTTDSAGKYAAPIIDMNGVVEVSAVGYAPQTKKYVSGKNQQLDFRLLKDAQQMENVVVTALGIKRDEKALGYAVTKLTGDQVTNALSNNWTNTLSGRVAGLNLIKSGGGPAGSTKIILRGENSLLGESEALIVVDGVIISGSSGKQTGNGSGAYGNSDSPVDFGTTLNDINPEDIENVSVLRGPSAAALYGSRGANGAIIITTKAGKPIQKGIGVTVNSNVAFEQVSRWPDYQYEYGQGDSGNDTWYSYNTSEDGPSTRSTSSAWGPKFDGQSYYQFDPVTGTKGETRTPWIPYKNNRKDFFRIGKTLTNSITVEGGNAKTSARMSFTNLKNDWILPNTGYSRNSVAFSLNQKVTDKLQMATKINFSNKTSGNLPTSGYNNHTLMYFLMGQVPNADLQWYKNSLWKPGYEDLDQNQMLSNGLDNPYLQVYEMLNKMNRNGVIGNLSAIYTINQYLSLMVRTTLDIAYEDRSQQRPKDSYNFKDGMYRTQNIYTHEMNSDFLLKYDRKFNEDFTAGLSIGGSSMNNRYIRDEVMAEKLRYPGEYTFANSMNLLLTSPYRSQMGNSSLYALAQVGYKNFLFADATLRNDWTSTLSSPEHKRNQSFAYPSLNLSAILSEFLNLPQQISYLKLRASVSGVGSGSTKPYLTSYTFVSQPFPSGLASPTSLPNLDLMPLHTTSIELGTTAKFFTGRLGLDVAVYKNNTTKQIFPVPVDRASGFNSVVLNTGAIENKGLEIELDGSPVKKKTGLNWRAYSTFSLNRNKVKELYPGIDAYVMSTGPRGTVEARPGGSMGDLYGLGYQRSPEGEIIYNDNGYPKLSETTRFIGNVNPKWKASFGHEFKYKQFGFNFLFDGQYGGIAYSLTHAVLMESGKLKKTLPGRYDGIIGKGVIENPDGTYRPNDVVATDMKAYYQGHFIRDNVESNTFRTDFIKLREVRLDYTIPLRNLKKLKIQRAIFAIYGRDLFMITDWPAFDPEVGSLGNGIITAGFETAQFPPTRTMGASLTIAF